jgi:hypothetical protein
LFFSYGPNSDPVPTLKLGQQIGPIGLTRKIPPPADANPYLPRQDWGPPFFLGAGQLGDGEARSTNPDVATFSNPSDGTTDGTTPTLLHAGTTSLVITTHDGTEVDQIEITVE